jgi:hypothetical protein
MARKSITRYPDFTIVYREDRKGFEGWYGGKAEAFRKTMEKVDLFFVNKYGQHGFPVGVRTYDLPVVSKAPEVKAPPAFKPRRLKPVVPVVVATVKVKSHPARAPRDLDFEPETFGSEERLDYADLDALL